jgi:hypothetical protein
MVRSQNRDEWAFYQNQVTGWSWQSLGGGARRTNGQFPGIVEAIADAVESGFQPGISKIVGVHRCRRLYSR